MTEQASALYAGAVMHQRLRPLRHRLRYRMFCLLLDLDEMPALAARLRLFSLNRFNLFSLHERDHGAPPGVSLREHIDAQLASAGIEAGGPVRLLAMPRMLGHAFNPLSIFFCEHRAGGLAAVIYEVRNTFGEQHRYLVEVAPDQARADTLQQCCDKQFHVSPFMDMGLRYHFSVSAPRPGCKAMRVAIAAVGADGPVLAANLDTLRQPLDDRTLLRAFLAHPLLGLKVLGAIHWQALRLLLKGAPLRRHPGKPLQAITVARLNDKPEP